MSFYINNSNPNRPGPICGNATNGICEKILIETTKVFDACVCSTTETGIIFQVSEFNPANPALPLTYVSAENTLGQSATISDLVVDRLETCPNYANVSFTITIPVTQTELLELLFQHWQSTNQWFCLFHNLHSLLLTLLQLEHSQAELALSLHQTCLQWLDAFKSLSKL